MAPSSSSTFFAWPLRLKRPASAAPARNAFCLLPHWAATLLDPPALALLRSCLVMHVHTTPRVVLLQCNPEDLERLADLRVAAMRQSLEAVGRFDEHRARARLRDNFEPQLTQLITLSGALAGFFMLKRSPGCLTLEHLYVHPTFQGKGVGSVVLRHIFHTADQQRVPVHVGALRDSPANRFYARHGFILVREEEFDIYYRRPPSTQEQHPRNE